MVKADYSEDGRRWENGHPRWFPVTDQEDELEIEVEDIGATSLPARLWTPWSPSTGPGTAGSWATLSADSRWPTYRAIGASFPATGLEDPGSKERGPRSNGAAWRSAPSSC